METTMAGTVIRGLVGVLGALAIGATHAAEIRDYYSEPGLNPFKETEGHNSTEHIDPFSGTLQLMYTDLKVPGNGGMDIVVSRTYTVPQGQPSEDDSVGVGWTIHFGRLVVPSQYANAICSQTAVGGNTDDNPSIERPDGGREMLFLNTNLNDGSLITKSNWRAECINPSDPSAGVMVTSPGGVQYRMDVRQTINTDQGGVDTSFETSLIEDLHGNTLTIAHGTITTGVNSGLRYITSVTASDSRVVTFSYLDENDLPVSALSKGARLSSVTANGQTWQYNYVQIPEIWPNMNGLHRYQLSEVVRPEGSAWQYQYNPDLGNGAGSFAVTQVTFPYGGITNYTYQKVRFYAGDVNETNVIATKATSGRDVVPGTWTYTFAPGSVLSSQTGRYLDETVVVAPNGKDRYLHYGHTYFYQTVNGLWAIGLLQRHELYATNDTLVWSEQPGWDKRRVSDEYYRHGHQSDPAYDDATYAAIQTQQYTTVDGRPHSVVFTGHDAYGNPTEKTEVATGWFESGSDQSDRVTQYTYLNDTSRWIIGRVQDETLVGEGTISRTFDPVTGDLLSESKYGVTTTYTYTAAGDIETTTDARSNVTTFSNYKRGTAQLEERPEGVSIARVVNDSGTVAQYTNGRGYTTGFSYDDLNRVVGIDFPINNDVTVQWLSDRKVLTRGSYQETVVFNGFAQAEETTRKDLSDPANTTVTTRTGYNALGQKVFESYPNSLEGETYVLDVRGRQTRVTHPDGSYRSTEYLGVEVEETNERGFVTTYKYHDYGDESQRMLQTTEQFDDQTQNTIETYTTRNKLGQLTRITQQGYAPDPSTGVLTLYAKARELGYDSRKFLTSEINPETGTTIYGRDEIGNMTTRQIGTSGTTIYVYDGLNRQTDINYPTGTSDVHIEYDGNNNVELASAGANVREYVYDENNNLTQEVITSGARAFAIDYAIDGNDFVSTVTYPSGRVVDYSPDAFGRPTAASPYVTSVLYHPNSQPSQFTYANGQVTQIAQNDRLWVSHITADNGAEIAVDLDYGYDVGGNVETITDTEDTENTRTLQYDSIDRLLMSQTAALTDQYQYDPWGNIVHRETDSWVQDRAHSNLRLARMDYDNGNYDLFGYDTYGNVTSHDKYRSPSNNFEEYTYNDAMQLTHAETTVDGFSVVSHEYEYDADGMRVSRDDGSLAKTYFVYARGGNLLGEYLNQNPEYGKEYFYLGSRLVASALKNSLPVADAGIDQSIGSGSLVTLNGTGSHDDDGSIVNFAWSQTAGPAVTLTGAGTAQPTFTAPGVSSDTTLTFSLSVTDDSGEQASDVVNVVVSYDAPPVANAGPDVQTLENEWVSFNGTASSDLEGPLTYAWSIASDSPSISTFYATGLDTATPRFRVSYSGQANTSETWRLTVTDSVGHTATDDVRLIVWDRDADSDSDGMPNGWEFIYFGGQTGVSPTADPDGDGVSNLDEYRNGTNPTVANVPASVAGIQLAPMPSAVRLTWPTAGGATTHSIYWSNSPALTPANGTRIANATSPYVHTGLTNGQPYYYLVVAENLAGASTPSTVVSMAPAPMTWTVQTDLIGSLGSAWATNATNGDLVSSVGVNASGDAVLAWDDQTCCDLSAATNVTGTWRLVPSENSNVTIMESAPDVAIDDQLDIAIGGAQGGSGYYMFGTYFDAAQGTWSENGKLLSSFQPCIWCKDSRMALLLPGVGRRLFHSYVTSSGNAVANVRYLETNTWLQSSSILIEGESTNGTMSTPSREMKIASNSSGQAISLWRRPNAPNSSYYSLAAAQYDATDSTYGDLTHAVIDGQSSATYNSSNHSVHAGNDGLGVAVWYQQTGSSAFTNMYAVYNFGTNSWGSATALPKSNNKKTLSQPMLVGNADGKRVVLQNESNVWMLVRTTAGSVSWSSPASMGFTPAADMRLGMDANGDVFVAYTSGTSIRARTYFWASNTWGTEQVLVSNGGTSPVVSSVTVAANGVKYVVWKASGTYHVASYRSVASDTPLAANAGIDIVSPLMTAVSLDGTGSTGTIVSYAWKQVGGTTRTILNADTATPQVLTGPANGWGDFQLTVTNELGATSTDVMRLTWDDGNVAPIANAGSDQSVSGGAVVALDGSGSTDPDGTIVSYAWQQTSGPSITLTGSTTATPGFTAPVVSTDTVITLQLTVTDNGGKTGSDTVSVTVRDTNVAPIANAGADFNSPDKTPVSLDGSASSDPDGSIASYAWTQTGGPAVTLSNATTATPSFTTPDVTASTVLTFQLTVTDNQGKTGADTIAVTVDDANVIPIANAGVDFSAPDLTVVSLNGTASSDPDGTITAYAWVQTGGPAVTLSGAATATPSFTAPDVTTSTPYTFQLTVTDNEGKTASDAVTVTVTDVNQPTGTPPVVVLGTVYPLQAFIEDEAPYVNYVDWGGSYDPDGSIDHYEVHVIEGAEHVVTPEPGVTTLPAWQFHTRDIPAGPDLPITIRVMAVDNNGLSSYQDYQTSVRDAANISACPSMSSRKAAGKKYVKIWTVPSPGTDQDNTDTPTLWFKVTNPSAVVETVTGDAVTGNWQQLTVDSEWRVTGALSFECAARTAGGYQQQQGIMTKTETPP
jgi:hypothetical protein